MKWYLGIAGAWLVAGIVLAGCTSTPTTETRTGTRVPVVREFKGQQGPFPDRGFFVVQRPEVWTALWAGRQAPSVDFTTQSVIVALMGQQPTAGYDITISDVRATGTQVTSYVNEERPAPGSTVAQVITYPYDMVVVPKINQPVAFAVGGRTIASSVIQDAFIGQQSAAVNPQMLVIRDPATWTAFWQANFGVNAVAPVVDFNRQMAVAVQIGRRPTTGYGVNITSADVVNDRMEVRYQVFAPQPGSVVAQVITSPFAIALLPVSSLPVAFRPTTATVVAGTTASTTTVPTLTPQPTPSY